MNMKDLTRRSFLKMSALTGAAATAAAFLASCSNGNDTTTSGNNSSGSTSTNSSGGSAVTQHIEAGQSVNTAEAVDTTRKTTKDTGERLPVLVVPSTSDMNDLSISAYMTKSNMSRIIFESLGINDPNTGWSQWVMVKKEENKGDAWFKFSGENEKFPETIVEAKEGEDGARHADVYDFEIYDYIHDWDNNPITAEDVVFSYKTDISSGKVFKYQAFITCEKVSDYVVRFYMDHEIMKQLNITEHPFNRFTVFSKKGYESGNYDSSPVATGPYKLVSFVAGSEAICEADDNYWQKDESLSPITQLRTVQTYRIPIIKETEQRINALATGAADIGSQISTSDLALFADGGEYADKYNVYRAASATLYALLFNCYEGHAGNDINFRIACCYGLSADAVATGAGPTYFAVKGFGSSGQTDFDPSLDNDENWQTQFDLAKAQEYLAKSSYGGETLVFNCGTREEDKNMAQVIQGLLEVLGVKCKIEALEQNVSEAYLPDPSKWDLHLVGTMGGQSFVAGANRQFGRVDYKTEPYIGYADCLGFQNDDKLFELFNKAASQEFFSKETTAEFARYIVDNAYMKALCGTYNNTVYTKKCAELAFAPNNDIYWNACNYYLD